MACNQLNKLSICISFLVLAFTIPNSIVQDNALVLLENLVEVFHDVHNSLRSHSTNQPVSKNKAILQ